MRAIIRFNIKRDTSTLETCRDVITGKIPDQFIPIDNNEAELKREEIISEAADEDRPILRNGVFYTIYLNNYRTWGIISEASKCCFEIKIRNKRPRDIKKSSEEIVKWLKDARKDIKSMKIEKEIEVFEPSSNIHAFVGDVLPKKLFKRAIKDNKSAFFVSLVSLFFFLFTAWLSYPGKYYLQQLVMTNEWWVGFFERFSTAMIVTCIISFFPIIYRWAELRREGLIEWHHY